MALGRPIRVALEARLWRDEKAAGRSRATAKAFDAAGGRPKATSGRALTARLVRRTSLTMLGHRPRRRSCHAGRSSAMKLHENLSDRL